MSNQEWTIQRHLTILGTQDTGQTKHKNTTKYRKLKR